MKDLELNAFREREWDWWDSGECGDPTTRRFRGVVVRKESSSLFNLTILFLTISAPKHRE
jgi:hypothetical protein